MHIFRPADAVDAAPTLVHLACGASTLESIGFNSTDAGLLRYGGSRYATNVIGLTTPSSRCWEFGADGVANSSRPQPCDSSRDIAYVQTALSYMVANAGIFVKNIVAHVVNNGAIDKTFKLFSKDGSASGGSVRLLIDFERFRDAIVVPPGEKFDIDAHKVKEDVAATKLQSAWRGKKARDELRRVGSGGALRALLAVAAAAVVGGLAFVVAKGAEGGGSAVGSKSGKGKKK